MDHAAAIILAAGKSTRMKSETPKVLHSVCGRALVEFVLDAVREAGVCRSIVVIGHKAEQVRLALSHHSDVEFALQEEQNGTGHAVMMCADHLADHEGPVLVLAGDTPLLRAESLAALLHEQRSRNAACVIGTAVTPANQGLGRIVRDETGEFSKIVEEKDATSAERQIQEINTGCFAFQGPDLFAALQEVRPNNRQAEYYLTDCPAILKSHGKRVLACPTFQIEEAMGVNTQEQLRQIETLLEARRLA